MLSIYIYFLRKEVEKHTNDLKQSLRWILINLLGGRRQLHTLQPKKNIRIYDLGLLTNKCCYREKKSRHEQYTRQREHGHDQESYIEEQKEKHHIFTRKCNFYCAKKWNCEEQINTKTTSQPTRNSDAIKANFQMVEGKVLKLQKTICIYSKGSSNS